MDNRKAQGPLTLFEGAEQMSVFSTEAELLSWIEAQDLDSYEVIDSAGGVFKICPQPRRAGLLDKLADILGAPAALSLVQKCVDG